eukprot:11234048-Alexandrium_andersonii.AAC.1
MGMLATPPWTQTHKCSHPPTLELHVDELCALDWHSHCRPDACTRTWTQAQTQAQTHASAQA